MRVLKALFVAGVLGSQNTSIAGAAQQPEAEVSPPGISWQELVFHARQLLGGVDARIQLRRENPPAPDLKDPGNEYDPPLLPGAEDVYLLTTDIEARFLTARKNWSGQAWFLDDNGAGLQRIRFKPGQDGSYKLYRYTRDGVYRERAEPASRSEAEGPPQDWTHVRRSFYSFRTSGQTCTTIADPYALLYLIAKADLDQPFRQALCMFNKKTLYRVGLRTTGTARLAVQYTEHKQGVSHNREKTVSAVRVVVSVTPLELENHDREAFEFLGLEGGLALLIDPASGIPLQIRGDVPGTGGMEFNLTEVTLAPDARPR